MEVKDNKIIDDGNVDNSDQILDEKTEKAQTVKFETYDRAMKSLNRAKAELTVTNEKLTAFEKAESAKEEKSLEEQGKFRERLELEQRKREEVEVKYDGLSERHFGAIKESALRRSVPKLLEDTDIDAIISVKASAILLDDDGFPIKESVEEIANEIKAKNFMFESSGKRNLPGDAPRNTSVLTYEKWLGLPLIERKSRYKEMRQNDRK